MKKQSILNLLLAITVIGCSSNKHDNTDLPFIDVRKNYPEKELLFTNFADISFIHLNADNADYLYKIAAHTVTKNTIVIYDGASCSFLFFSKDGTPKSRFNRLGQGPEEYFGADINRILYNEETDEVFYTNQNMSKIQVYSSTGQYKRSIPLPPEVTPYSIVSFDHESFLVFKNKSIATISDGKNKFYIPKYTVYYQISKTNGEILDSLQLPNDETVNLKAVDQKGSSLQLFLINRLVKGRNGFCLCNPETDTVYLYANNKSLTPIFRKIPSARDLDPPIVVITNIVDASRYQFFALKTIYYEEQSMRNPKYPDRHYFRDKETGEIFRQKIILPEYKGKEFQIDVGRRIGFGEDNGSTFHLDLIELKQAYEENRLSGKLKELVATLNELKDNDVLMIAYFK